MVLSQLDTSFLSLRSLYLNLVGIPRLNNTIKSGKVNSRVLVVFVARSRASYNSLATSD